jgi:hypothetical protein
MLKQQTRPALKDSGEVSRVIKPPKDIEYRAIYEPDMERMVRALRILLESSPEKKAEQNLKQEDKKTA